MTTYVFDIETNGFLNTMDRVHSLVLKDVETGEVLSCHHPDERDNPIIETGLRALMAADLIVGHNIIKFDIPAIKKVYPWFQIDQSKVFDTVVASRVIWTDLFDTDMVNIRRRKTTLTNKLAGGHSLEAWGHRLGQWKGDYAKIMEERGLDPWAEWNEEMQAYCEQDVEVNEALYNLIVSKDYAKQALDLEHAVAFILAEQERNGFAFNVDAAEDLYRTLLTKKAELDDKLQSIFEPWEVSLGTFVPKRPNSKLGYTGRWEEGVDPVTGEKWKKFIGDPVEKTKTVVFNPNSRDHIADRLKVIYGWKPTDFTPSGKPKVDEDVLSELKYPEAAQLAEFMLVQKRIGQLAEGKQAWLKHVTPEGRIHGGIIGNGAVTGRATHSNPNIGQVPKVGSPYGAECRGLFTATPGETFLLGCDVSGLELRMLGHFMALHDGGAYADIVINGDIHSANAAALFGLTYEEVLEGKGGIHKDKREIAKTFIYAFLYGAGLVKLASILGVSVRKAGLIRREFLGNLPALGNLLEGVQRAAEGRGWLRGLDGRKLHIRSPHAALNTLLQSAGALVCKQWMVEFHRLLSERGYADKVWQVAWVHDELQMEVHKSLVFGSPGEYSSVIGELCVKGIEQAGAVFNIRVPLTGEYGIGHNWADTH